MVDEYTDVGQSGIHLLIPVKAYLWNHYYVPHTALHF